MSFELVYAEPKGMFVFFNLPKQVDLTSLYSQGFDLVFVLDNDVVSIHEIGIGQHLFIHWYMWKMKMLVVNNV